MSTAWTFGPAGSYTATWDGSSIVTVTQTTGSAFVASFAAQSLAAAIASPEYQAILSPAPNSLSGLSLAATTGVSGFALQNATPTILTWTVPNDGALHRVMLICELVVSSLETGGQISMTFTDPGAAARTRTVYAAALAAGLQVPAPQLWVVQAGTTVTLSQSTALTAGAAVLWAEFWAL